ncbi:MAG TPA: hypothetical protein VFW27_05200 [Actinoplanes sp.]|jgi:thiosulfate dehydrogenase [quinone] large subunit|nr:hypothetical protein [Actinoplanes sp.]
MMTRRPARGILRQSAVVLALTYAGHTWGLGRRWAALPVVRKNRWLI